MLVTYWSVDFTLLFEYPYFFGRYSVDKIWLAEFFWRIICVKNQNSAISGGFGSKCEIVVLSDQAFKAAQIQTGTGRSLDNAKNWTVDQLNKYLQEADGAQTQMASKAKLLVMPVWPEMYLQNIQIMMHYSLLSHSTESDLNHSLGVNCKAGHYYLTCLIGTFPKYVLQQQP